MRTQDVKEAPGVGVRVINLPSPAGAGMYLREANELLRRAIITGYFEPQLRRLGYKRTQRRHPSYRARALSRDHVLYLFFDISTGSEYPDGDEWFIVDYVFPFSRELPDTLKSPDYFTRLMSGGRRMSWRHRELVRYKIGRVKRLDEALDFIDRKAQELAKALKAASVIGRGVKRAARSARPT